jgi:hypothetical protein
MIIVWLCLLYDEGQGIKQNVKRAHKLYEQAAAQGHGAGLFCPAFNHHFGVAVSVDLVKARQFFEEAVAACDAQSLVNLGIPLSEGFGVEQDSVKVAELFRRAGEQGRFNGHYFYADCILEGQVPDIDRSVAF